MIDCPKCKKIREFIKNLTAGQVAFYDLTGCKSPKSADLIAKKILQILNEKEK